MNGLGASMFTVRVSMQLNPNRTVLAVVFRAIAIAAVLAAGPLVAAGEAFREIRVEPSPLVFSGPVPLDEFWSRGSRFRENGGT